MAKNSFSRILRTTKKNNKANREALERQKQFPELTCTTTILEPLLPDNPEPEFRRELLCVGDVVRIYRVSAKDPVDGAELYCVTNIRANKGASLFLTQKEIEYHFDTSVFSRWEDVPYMQMGFKLESPTEAVTKS